VNLGFSGTEDVTLTALQRPIQIVVCFAEYAWRDLSPQHGSGPQSEAQQQRPPGRTSRPIPQVTVLLPQPD